MKTIRKIFLLGLIGASLMGNVSCESSGSGYDSTDIRRPQGAGEDDRAYQARQDYTNHTGVFAPSSAKSR